MRAPFAGRLEAYLKALLGVRRPRSASFERFRLSFFERRSAARDGLDTAALMRLRGRERECAERMMIEALPDLRAVTGLGALRSRRAEPRLLALFATECAAAQAARIAEDGAWRADGLVAASRALWRIDPQPRYVRTLIGTLACGRTGAERMDAAKALAEMRSPDVEDALIEALKDRDALVRHHAARGLLTIHGVDFDARAVNRMVGRAAADDGRGREEVSAASDGRPPETSATPIRNLRRR